MKLKRLSTVLALILGASALSTVPAQSAPDRSASSPAQATSPTATAATEYIWKNRVSLKYLYAQTDRDVIALGKSSESQVTSYGRWTATFNGSYRLYRNKAMDLCLDSNSNGNVYLRSCSTGNNFQNWLLVSEGGGFYRLKNRATGLCLDSSHAGSVYTNPCSSSNAYQHWS